MPTILPPPAGKIHFAVDRSAARAEACRDLLRDVLGAIDQAPIFEAQVPISLHEGHRVFSFGTHEPDGSITLNVPLLRVMIALHELTHRVRPGWSERTVRARSSELLRALNDSAVATINRDLLDVIRGR